MTTAPRGGPNRIGPCGSSSRCRIQSGVLLMAVSFSYRLDNHAGRRAKGAPDQGQSLQRGPCCTRCMALYPLHLQRSAAAASRSVNVRTADAASLHRRAVEARDALVEKAGNLSDRSNI
jgi:hypothetical protein